MAKKEKDIKTKKQKSHYFKDMKAELKKVIWPTPKQLLNNTLAVIAFTVIIAVIVFVLDLCFDSINKYGITAIQEKIQSSYHSSNETESTDEGSEIDNGEETIGNEETPAIEEEAVNEETPVVEEETVNEGRIEKENNSGNAETENSSESAENVEDAKNEE